LPQGKKLK
jgi:hypothetical protein